jgi:DNA-binding Lrp family transcriptional regulator
VDEKPLIFDELDHQLIHALQVDGRVPFARLGQLLGVSEQTVARRFRRLRSGGIVRVLGLVDPVPLGESSWIVRIQSRPDAATSLADALARRPDVGWVSLTSGGTEIICVTRSRTSSLRNELLLQRLPKTAPVIGLGAQAVMHRFENLNGWTTGQGQLDQPQIDSLLAQAIGSGVRSGSARPATVSDAGLDRGTGPDPSARSPRLSAEDEAMLAVLALDGRAPIVQLAALTGWTPAKVSRRLEELVGVGLLYFDAEVALVPLGFRSQAFLWLTVGSADLHATGVELAGHGPVVFVAATTGATNLVASVVCRDQAHLYRYVTDGLGSLEALRHLEISPFLRRVKQGGSMMDGERLAVAAQ